MDRHGSYIRNEHGFKMSSSKYTVETISSCVKQNGKNNKVFPCHIFSVKTLKTLDLFGVPLQTSLFYHYCLAYTVNILFKMLRLYIYTDQCNIGSSSNYNIYILCHFLLARRVYFQMISTFASELLYKGYLKWKIILIFLKIACINSE